ncbi:MAG TPA: MGMT family protein [Chitinophagaceae bacterium]|nr:MGMT family protein [Chitinophagaceae bacterium]
MPDLLVIGTDWYPDPDGRMVLTEQYLLRRGYCCGNGCRHCPYGMTGPGDGKNAKLVTSSMKEDKDQDQASFFEAVFRIARQIPKGRVTTYGAIAESAGTRLSARMVGWAMNSSHRSRPPVPAHRVVNRNGMLTGKNHFGTPTLMQELLEQEGVRVKNDTVVDFRKLFWDPSVKG